MLLRLLQIALGLSAVISAALLAGRTRLPLVFSRDPAVVALVAGTVPLLAVCMVRPARLWASACSMSWLAQSCGEAGSVLQQVYGVLPCRQLGERSDVRALIVMGAWQRGTGGCRRACLHIHSTGNTV